MAALLGALAPDLSLYLMAGVSLYILDVPARIVFREYYYSDAWQQVFAIDNSFVLWGILLVVALWRKGPALIAFAGAGLMHLALDFPLHNHDARQHFWPLTDWVFISPVSYWDSDHYGRVVGPLEIAICLVLCVMLWLRFRDWGTRTVVAGAAGLQMAPVVIWGMMF